MAIALVGCYKGFTISVAGGAEGVGKATTGSAVVSLMLILVLGRATEPSAIYSSATEIGDYRGTILGGPIILGL